MLIGNFITSLFDVAKYGFFSIFLYIDSVVYKLVSMLFSVFYSLAELQLLNNEVYESIANRVYLLVGVVALFTMTISLLKALVDPDSLAKGTITSFKNLIISIVLLILTPTIFKYAFSFQAAIINDGIITNLFNFTITGKENTMVNTCNNPRSVTVNNAEMGTLNSNNVQNNKEIKMTVNECQSNYITMTILEAFFSPSVDSIQNNYNTSWKDARDYIYYSGDFAYIATFAEQVNKGSGDKYISYYILISTLAGLFLGYIVLSFCLDLGIRAFKLAFYQLIAPIPILMKIVPGKEGQFEKWSKQTISTFLEVFTRLIIISFVVFMCGNMFDLLEGLNWSGVGLLGKAILAIGMFAFAKQAPNLLKDALGLDGSGIKLGIKGKLTDVPIAGKAFGAGYALADKGVSAAKGYVTGGLGAGWSSLVNGNGFRSGFKYGSAMGAKGGGNQFSSQRQGFYNKYGGKGTAGIFGGRAFLDKYADSADKAAKNDIKEKFRKTSIYNNRLDSVLSDKNKELMANRQAQINAQNVLNDYKKNIHDFEESDEFNGIMARFADEAQIKAKQQLQQKVKNGEISLGDARNQIDKLTKDIQKASTINYLKENAAKGIVSDSSKKYIDSVANLDVALKSFENSQKLQTTLSSGDIEKAKKITDEFFRTTSNKNNELGGDLGKAYQQILRSDYNNDLSTNDDVLRMAQAMKMAQEGGFNKDAKPQNDGKETKK